MLQIMGVGIEALITYDRPPIVPPNGGIHTIQKQIHHPKNSMKLTMKASNQYQGPAHQTQSDGFVKNGNVDLHSCYDEINRRAAEIGCPDFECSFERFRALATENGDITSTTAREAITILQVEMNGYYRNAAPENYRNGIYGPNFRVIGQGEYSHVTHVEVKNPVGSDIEKSFRNGYSNLVKQGNKIGVKLSKQQAKWSNATFRAG